MWSCSPSERPISRSSPAPPASKPQRRSSPPRASSTSRRRIASANEVSPEIDSIRAQVERQSAEQRLTNAANQLEKDKLTLARIIGMAVDQDFILTDSLASHPTVVMTGEAAVEEALRSRADLRSAEASVCAAEFTLRAQKAQRLPVVSLTADYGGGGTNIGKFQPGLYPRREYFGTTLHRRPDRGRYCAGPGRPEPSRGRVSGPEGPRRATMSASHGST